MLNVELWNGEDNRYTQNVNIVRPLRLRITHNRPIPIDMSLHTVPTTLATLVMNSLYYRGQAAQRAAKVRSWRGYLQDK